MPIILIKTTLLLPADPIGVPQGSKWGLGQRCQFGQKHSFLEVVIQGDPTTSSKFLSKQASRESWSRATSPCECNQTFLVKSVSSDLTRHKPTYWPWTCVWMSWRIFLTLDLPLCIIPLWWDKTWAEGKVQESNADSGCYLRCRVLKESRWRRPIEFWFLKMDHENWMSFKGVNLLLLISMAQSLISTNHFSDHRPLCLSEHKPHHHHRWLLHLLHPKRMITQKSQAIKRVHISQRCMSQWPPLLNQPTDNYHLSIHCALSFQVIQLLQLVKILLSTSLKPIKRK